MVGDTGLGITKRDRYTVWGMKPPHTVHPGGGNRRPSTGNPRQPLSQNGPRPYGVGQRPNAQGPRPLAQSVRPEGLRREERASERGSGPPLASRSLGDRSSENRRPPHHGGGSRPAEAPRGAVWIYGLHAVGAALANPARRLRRLLLTEEAEHTLAERLKQPGALAPERTERGRLDHLLGRDVVHQGAALLADLLPPPSLHAALDRSGPLLVLDQVTDPRNVGAILRSAAAFEAAAVITQDRNAPEETGSLAKAASGALETVPLMRAVNIARTLIALKAAGCWVVGLDARGGAPLSGPALAGRRAALVLGAEGEGLRRLTRDTCDEVARLAMPGGIDSLNVSAAAAVALYELARRG